MSVMVLPAYDEKDDVRELFTEYTDMLIEGDAEFAKYLEMQNYEEEVENLEDKYGMPEGRLFLAYEDDRLAGCVGLLKVDDDCCELKRLYVRPEFRGQHLGMFLMEMIMDEAREIGYRYMRLDTLPFLEEAQQMYEDLGFQEIERYNDSPMDSSIYMSKEL